MKFTHILALGLFATGIGTTFATSTDTIPQQKFTHEVGMYFSPLIFQNWNPNSGIYYYKLHLPNGKMSLRAMVNFDLNNSDRDLFPYKNTYMNILPDDLRISKDQYSSLSMQLGLQHKLKTYPGKHPMEVFCFEGLMVTKNSSSYNYFQAMQMHINSGDDKYTLDRFRLSSNTGNLFQLGGFAGIGASYYIFPHLKFTVETNISGYREISESKTTSRYYSYGLNGFVDEGKEEITQDYMNKATIMSFRPATYLYIAYTF